MESTMLRVCVFGSSSPKTPQQYKDEAFALGRLLAERRHVCVNGGGGQGVMGATNDGCRAGGGAIVGVIHEMFCVDNDEDNKIPNMIKASGPNLDERKQLLMDHSDCFLVMPGGTGTFDEVWDVVSHRSLGMKGLKGKPLVLVNTQGFYDGFVTQLQRAASDGILYGPLESYLHVCGSAREALDWAEGQASAAAGAAVAGAAVDSRVQSRAKEAGNGGRVVAVACAAFALGFAAAAALLLRRR